ncbi:DUF2063 domain-containing protein [Methylovorus sp. MM2]|uniref:HvfC family RiPP maturation protein n=1 Tax=Methylovorus sp. MM2 TaxID=1848038 RepID=UPI0007DEBB69|nr:putative DNA-binding domain-containing protein [Methylovorus sp. MM2]OAM52575.1 DUF2063 domain-containing protein [Methylovorus sp. MM2]
MSDVGLSDLTAYQLAFTAHIRDPKNNVRPKNVLAKRMRVYTEIVFNNIESSVAACFPVTQKVLGKRAWLKLVRGFFANHSAQSPMFRDIPKSFLDYLETCDGLPPYLTSLAHYEWVELAVAVADVSVDIEAIDIAGDYLAKAPVLSASLAVHQYDYPVQQISPLLKPFEPLAEPVYLLVFRDIEDTVRFIELNSVTARLVGILQEEQLTGQQALEKLANEMPHIEPQLIYTFGAELMQDLKLQDVILGSKRSQ